MALKPKAYMGTPRRSVRAKILWELPSFARPYRVLVAMYRSEFAAENTKMRMQAFKKPGSVWMPLSIRATTKGEAEAPVVCFVAKDKALEL